jgi:hypothetical protein
LFKQQSGVYLASTAATWTNYDWYVDASLVQSGASDTYVFTGTAGSHSVYCVVTDSYSQVGTSNTATINVNQSPLVGTANISLSSVCAGDPTVLSLTSSTGTIQWQSWNGSSWQNIGTGSPLTVYPTSSTSYQAVVSTTGCGSVVSNSVSVNVGGNFVWKGSVSSSWNNPLNWCNGTAPNSSTAIVSIGNSSTYTNALDFSGVRTCASLTLDNGGSMTFSSGTLTVMGNVDINGSLSFTNGYLKVGGTYSQAGTLSHTGGTLELQLLKMFLTTLTTSLC